MKQKYSLVVILGILLIVSGCAGLNKSQYNTPMNVTLKAPLKADVDVNVGEKISGTASSTVVLFIFEIGRPTKFADGVTYKTSSGVGLAAMEYGTVHRLKAAAAYDAVTKAKADILVAPNYVVDVQDQFFFKTINVTVTGYKGTIKSIKTDNDPPSK